MYVYIYIYTLVCIYIYIYIYVYIRMYVYTLDGMSETMSECCVSGWGSSHAQSHHGNLGVGWNLTSFGNIFLRGWSHSPQWKDMVSMMRKTVEFDGCSTTFIDIYRYPDSIDTGGGLEHFLFFHSVGNGKIIPTDELTPSFFRGVGWKHQPDYYQPSLTIYLPLS